MATKSRPSTVNDDLTGVSNPYALAELVSGRTIDWAAVPDRRRVLEETLRTPYEQLFDPVHGSPLYLGVQVNAQGKLEAVRPAVLDVTLPDAASDLDRFSFGDLRGVNRIGDLGAFFDTKDVESILVDHAEMVEPGVLRLRVAQVTESRLAQLARVFTPRVVTSIFDSPVVGPLDDITFEPPVSYWGDYGTFFAEAAEFSDPVQGSVANCYLIAAMAAVAWAQPYRIQHLTRATGAGQQQFVNNVRLWQWDTHAATEVEVTDAIPLRYSNNKPMYARSSEVGETWPSILEKAFAKWESGHHGDTPNIASTAYGSCTKACATLTGLNRWVVGTADAGADELWDLVRQNSLSRRTFNPVVAATYGTGADSPDKVIYSDANLVANHCYTVLGWDYRNGTKFIILRNPWGSTEATLGQLNGSVSFYDISWWRTINLADSDGVFGLEASVFTSYFSGIGGAKP